MFSFDHLLSTIVGFDRISSTTMLIAPIRIASVSKPDNNISAFGLMSERECSVAVSLIEGRRYFPTTLSDPPRMILSGLKISIKLAKPSPRAVPVSASASRASLSPWSAACLIIEIVRGVPCSTMRLWIMLSWLLSRRACTLRMTEC